MESIISKPPIISKLPIVKTNPDQLKHLQQYQSKPYESHVSRKTSESQTGIPQKQQHQMLSSCGFLNITYSTN